LHSLLHISFAEAEAHLILFFISLAIHFASPKRSEGIGSAEAEAEMLTHYSFRPFVLSFSYSLCFPSLLVHFAKRSNRGVCFAKQNATLASAEPMRRQSRCKEKIRKEFSSSPFLRIGIGSAEAEEKVKERRRAKEPNSSCKRKKKCKNLLLKKCLFFFSKKEKKRRSQNTTYFCLFHINNLVYQSKIGNKKYLINI
jgi:hypothetical protein